MYCRAAKDYDMRVQIGNGKVHGARMSEYGGFTRYMMGGDRERIPVQNVVSIACKWKHIPEDSPHITDKRKTITCKNCQKAMGMAEGAVFPDRFVIRKKDTGEFYKNTRSRCSVWSEDISDAWLWKRKGDAKRITHHKRWEIDGQLLTYSELLKRGLNYRTARGKEVRIADPNLEIRKVKITLE